MKASETIAAPNVIELISYCLVVPLCICILGCSGGNDDSRYAQEGLVGVDHIAAQADYLASPFVTAGDRLYMVGYQDGTFPDLGWHVEGEMGGIWDHPIKLMDGFNAAVYLDDQVYCLAHADSFVNYPFANKHIYRSVLPGAEIERLQFVPDAEEAIVIEYMFLNKTGHPTRFSFEFTAMTDLRPVWLGERTGMKDGKDSAAWNEKCQCMVAKDSLSDWYVAWGASVRPDYLEIGSAGCVTPHKGKGVNASMAFDVSLRANGRASVPITVAGSYHSLDSAIATFSRVKQGRLSFLKAKRDRYGVIDGAAHLSIPDTILQEAYRWAKYNTDWLIRDVPEIGRGLGAGMPDYPWWFGCDNTYTLQAVLATGRPEIARSTIRLLARLSMDVNGNGRVLHEASTNGVVFNPGNINETPQFVSLLWWFYKWTGDRAFLSEFYPMVTNGLSWLLAENDPDKNFLPDGFGMMEIHGLNSEMIDVASYTQRAFADAAKMAAVLEDSVSSTRYLNIAQLLKRRINSVFWVPEARSYADFIGTAAQARQLADDAIVRADTLQKPWAVKELMEAKAVISRYPASKRQGFVLYHNWVVNTPMEMGIADSAKALQALETGRQFVNPFGVFVTGIDRDESSANNTGSFAEGKKVFSYVGAVMTLPTGVQAIAENNYGNPDQALDYLHRLVRSFSYALPGSMYEVSPDFGMMTQAWTLYSLAVPIVRQFFGIDPYAFSHSIHIHPQMPSQWKTASISRVVVGDNNISVDFERIENGISLEINQSNPGWEIVVSYPRGRYERWEVNGMERLPDSQGNEEKVTATGKKLKFILISAGR